MSAKAAKISDFIHRLRHQPAEVLSKEQSKKSRDFMFACQRAGGRLLDVEDSQICELGDTMVQLRADGHASVWERHDEGKEVHFNADRVRVADLRDEENIKVGDMLVLEGDDNSCSVSLHRCRCRIGWDDLRR